MGLPHRQLYATNTGDDKIILTSWIPEKKDGGYYMPAGTPLGRDIWVNNTINLKEEEGTVPVMVVRSKRVTGIWIVCENGYFAAEQWLYNYKPRWDENKLRLDYEWAEKHIEGDDIFGIHIMTDIEMKHGDGPWPVTLERGEYPKEEKKIPFWKKFGMVLGLCKKNKQL